MDASPADLIHMETESDEIFVHTDDHSVKKHIETDITSFSPTNFPWKNTHLSKTD